MQENIKKKYNKGYCAAVVGCKDIHSENWLKELAVQCEEFVLGIPDEWIFARLFGNKEYSAEKTKKFWMDTGWFSDVVILDAEHLSYQKIFEKIHFNVCFYGTQYGQAFLADRKFFAERGVAFVSRVPDKKIVADGNKSIKIALDDLTRNQKIVLFGTGKYFDAYMEEYGKKYSPAYAVDNDSAKWETEKSGVKIYKPDVLKKEAIEDILVVICSKNYLDIQKQLDAYGAYNFRTRLFFDKIALLEEFGIAAQKEQIYLKESHQILEKLMQEFDRICQKHHLHYYMICGSLIGVVRHQGMIPWDDDIDIAMPRKDFKKLRRIAKKEWTKNNKTFMYLDYYDIGGGAFLDCMPRLFFMEKNLPTKCFDKVSGRASKIIEDRMFLDIYVLDYAHKNERIHNLVINCMKGIYNLMMGHRAYVNYEEYRTQIDDKTIKLMKVLHKIGKYIPLRFLAFGYDFLARSGNWNKGASDYIMDSCAIRCIELKYPVKDYGEGRRMPFQNIEVMVPSDYDSQLNAMRYKNYMEFPRMAVRKPSHYFNSDIEIW